ncbi:androgen-dependent TFPI-regulating protein-like [Anoplophora glabripennis]|uniref:androgen-dependent TFPI-regulating protein-like n=1 Tax=Anoplophora glabripennis TaxID=217634 RepID=UPI0008749257|nr:androgen-dependent TFPI-regulating protein-like [Anoplophora glabripennis]
MTRVRDILGPFFHVAVCIHHIYAIFYSNKPKDLSQVIDERVLNMERFAPVYFTSWNMVIQTLYFLLAMLYDILHIFTRQSNLEGKIQLYKGYIFTSLVFPCSLFVSAMFWSVYSINREWVLPEVLDEYVPEWLNHCLHTNIVVFLVIEVLIVNQLLPTFKSAFIGLTILSTIYNTTFLCVYFSSGKWIYGLFYIFSWPERIAFMCSNYLFTVMIMKAGIKIQSLKHKLIRTTLQKKVKNQ